MGPIPRVLIFLSLSATLSSAAQDRIVRPIDSTALATLKSPTHRNIRAEDDRGPVDPAMPITYATLCLQPAAGLEAFLADQQNRSSPNYHRWLTPEQFGDRFGLTQNDIGKITAWMKSEGFTVHDVARGRHWITFSGTAGQAAHAFHAQIHRYVIDGQTHYASATDISVPAALESAISGIDGLDDFRLQPYYKKLPGAVNPAYTTGGSHYLVPDDLATIYDIGPLYAAGTDGTGQNIAIIGQTDINLSDIRQFRAEFGLAPNDPQVVLYGPDPGTSATDLPEADLDLELSGSVARNATIFFVNSYSVVLSAQYAVDQNLAPVMSESYGGCETNTSITSRSVAQQANAQGITWLIAAGDSAAATCDRDSPTPQAEKGDTVSFPASVPEVTAVGGTEFNEGSGRFWSSRNTTTYASALSYIPERVWNDTALINELDGGGGGASAIYPKPLWQTGPGVPNDGARDLPDGLVP
jgi:subtilase family serine protease